MTQLALSPPQLSLPGQLLPPLQRRSQLSASQRTSLMHAPCFSQRTSHELPPHVRLPEQLFSPAQLMMMRERGIPVVLGADAHTPLRVADGYGTALRTLQAAGYERVSFFLERKRQDVPITEALASLR